MRANYHSGFAPRDFAPRYPNLWKGCVTAMCPCLGHSGLTLYDWSGRRSNTSSSITTTWEVSSGCYALRNNGSQSITQPHKAWYAFERTDSFSYACWVKSSNAAGTNTLVSKWDSATGGGTYLINEPTTGYMRMFIQGTANYIEVKGAVNCFDNVWHHVAVTYNGTSLASGVKLYVDGKADTMTTVTDTLATSIANTTSMTWTTRPNGSLRLTGSIDDMFVYNRVLNPMEIALLATERGVAYTPIRRRRFVPSAAATAVGPLIGGRLTRPMLIDGRLVA